MAKTAKNDKDSLEAPMFNGVKRGFKKLITFALFLMSSVSIDHLSSYLASNSSTFDCSQAILSGLVLVGIYTGLLSVTKDPKTLLLYSAIFSWFLFVQVLDLAKMDLAAFRDLYCSQSKLIVNLFSKFLSFWLIERCMEP